MLDSDLGHIILRIEMSLRTSIAALIRFGVPVRLGIVIISGAGIRTGRIVGDNTSVVLIMIVLLMICHRYKE